MFHSPISITVLLLAPQVIARPVRGTGCIKDNRRVPLFFSIFWNSHSEEWFIVAEHPLSHSSVSYESPFQWAIEERQSVCALLPLRRLTWLAHSNHLNDTWLGSRQQAHVTWTCGTVGKTALNCWRGHVAISTARKHISRNFQYSICREVSPRWPSTLGDLFELLARPAGLQ